MGCEYTCDHCGKKAPAGQDYMGKFIKPHKWYSRTDFETKETFIACSRSCCEELGGLMAPW